MQSEMPLTPDLYFLVKSDKTKICSLTRQADHFLFHSVQAPDPRPCSSKHRIMHTLVKFETDTGQHNNSEKVEVQGLGVYS